MIRFFCVLLATGLVGACSHSHGPPLTPSVAVTTVPPVQRVFHRNVPAIGVAIADPGHARRLSVAHSGQVTAVLVQDGQLVKAGDTLFKLATDPIARKTYQQAQNAMDLARSELDRDRMLAAQHLATHAQVEAARKTLKNAQAALTAQRQLGGARAVDTIVAPVSGTVAGIQVVRGQRIPAATVLASLLPSQGLIAKLGVSPDQAARITPGMPATLHAVYEPARTLQGKVVMVGHAVNPVTHLISILVTLPSKPEHAPVVNTALSALIQSASYRAWAIPRSALRHDADGNFLFQVHAGKARRVAVTVRSPEGTVVGVTGDLDPVASIIVEGSYEVTDGQMVRIKSPRKNPAARNMKR